MAASMSVVLVFGWSGAVFAQSSSNSYKVEESTFGTGAQLEGASASYKAQSTTGDLGVGSLSGTSYDATAGFLTPSEPYLEMFVTGATVDFGILSDITTSFGSAQGGACSCSFAVRSYLSSDYVVVTMSQPPTNENGRSMAPKTVLGVPSSNVDIEEFGINLVANSSPSMGQNSVNIPDNTFADGQAASNYNVPNQFKYAVGDVVARSQSTVGNPAIGQTNYTVSYIAKRKPITEAGVYTMDHYLVVVPTF